jgi:c-di-GMP-binding flagellar brake protein YcgR
MNMQTLKLITVKFEKMSDADETALRAFLTRELAQKQARYDEPDTNEKKQRETFRVKLTNVHIRVITEATMKVPQQEMDVLLDDISVGGCCIGVPQTTPVVKGGTIYLTLNFCQPSISLRGTILGLKPV